MEYQSEFKAGIYPKKSFLTRFYFPLVVIGDGRKIQFSRALCVEEQIQDDGSSS